MVCQTSFFAAFFLTAAVFSALIYVSAGGTHADAVKLYQKVFKSKRVEHLKAVRAVIKMKTYQKQYQMVEAVTTAMQHVVETSKLSLEENGFSVGDPFPAESEETVKNALSLVLENSALFADLVLVVPDITKQIYNKKIPFKNLMDWGLQFSNSTGFYDQRTTSVMHLAGQELGLVEKDQNFENPYADMIKKAKADGSKPDAEKMEEKPKKDKEKKQKRKGPSISRGNMEL